MTTVPSPTRGSGFLATVAARRRLKAIGVVGGAALAGYLVTCWAYPTPMLSRENTVIRVFSLPLTEAQQQLTAQGFRVKVDDEESDPVVPAGRILWQDPPADVALPKGSTVHLTVSRGPASVGVPDVIAFDAEQAKRVINAAGLNVGARDSVPAEFPAGVVVATRPPAGTGKNPGTTVDLVLSRGPADIKIPNVVGQHLEDARHQLEALGLRVGRVTSRAVRRGAAAIVLEQRPVAGVMSPRDARVDLIVSQP